MLAGNSFTPLDNHLLIMLKPRVKESGGIIIPEISQTPHVEGEVVASGEKVINVRDGHTVLIPRTCGTRCVVAKKEYVIVRETDVVALVEDV